MASLSLYGRKKGRAGFSLIELTIVIAITAIIIAALTMLVGRTFSVSRGQLTQTRTTEEARVQIERMSDTIRNAQTLNCDGNNEPDKPEEWWLQVAEPYNIVVYTNVDDDVEAERVTYTLNDTTLVRQIAEPLGVPCSFDAGVESAVAASIQNVNVRPLFHFITHDGATLPFPVDLQQVVRVSIDLLVDSNTEDAADGVAVVTDVTPRLAQQLTATPSVTPMPNTPTPSPTPAGPLQLRVADELSKFSPARSPTGPVYLDLGEKWFTTMLLGSQSTGTVISSTDPDLSFTSLTPSIVTVSTVPATRGQLFGNQPGVGRVTATYRSETLTFDVHVRPGCWGNTDGAWVTVPPGLAPRSEICRSAGYSAEGYCGRRCEEGVTGQPGSDVQFTGHGAPEPQSLVQQCTPFIDQRAAVYQQIFCINR